MSETTALLLALQHADGQFPSGSFAFSWGLEGLVSDGLVARKDLADFIKGQLRYKWGSFDRPVLLEAYSLAGNGAAALCDLDGTVNAWSLSAPQRDGSRRAGLALLGIHVSLATPGAAEFRQLVTDRIAIGHLPVVQGLVWRGIGLDVTSCQVIAAYGYASGLAAAAIRLGAAGHLDGQRAISKVRSEIAAIIDSQHPSLEEIHSFVPLAEIAMLTHARSSVRIFSN